MAAKYKCPCCGEPNDLVIYVKMAVLLHDHHYDYKAMPIVNEETDVTCLHCYWQGKTKELLGVGGAQPLEHVKLKAERWIKWLRHEELEDEE